VTLVGQGKDARLPQRANIMMRYNRNPVIGDKFSSRHGQKGVLSILWPDVDMPWCAGTGGWLEVCVGGGGAGEGGAPAAAALLQQLPAAGWRGG
jgi:hypothetical protein